MKNIAEILKNYPQGTKLYSPICGECELHMIDNDTITCSFSKNLYHICFDIYGHYKIAAYKNSECLLFPSKENRNWNNFIPFKDGDIIFEDRFHSICIFKKEGSIKGTVDYYTGMSFGGFYVKDEKNIDEHFGDISYYRFATEEEKQKLFKAIKDNGYKWNAETKTLEKLIVPKFKVGDRIRHKSGRCSSCTIKAIENNVYILKEIWSTLPISEQHEYELIPNKFDISTLKPFDKVLVRTEKFQNTWIASFFSHKDDYEFAPFWTISGKNYQQCIPFEGNEHLVGTTNDCDEYYKNW